MKLKNHKHIVLFVAMMAITLLLYIWFVNSPHFDIFKTWSKDHLVMYVSVLLGIKIAGIIWPPIPGGIFTIASVPVLGWFGAYLVDFSGSLIGSTAAFFIARKWGLNFIQRIFDQGTFERIMKIKIKKSREIESVFLMRIFGGTIIEAVCYGAGILGVSYRNFLVASILSHIPLGLTVFYFAGNILSGRGATVGVILLVILVFLFYKFKDRYFEYGKEN